MVGLPRDIIENARVDGATEFQIFLKIILPLSFPALASFAIFQFLWTWNDLLVALVFLGTGNDQLVLTGNLVNLLGSRGGDWEILSASAFVSIAVPLAVFFSMQRFLVRGLAGGVGQVSVTMLPKDPDWWRGAVIYQIYPRSYQDSDGDGIGDLKGIATRLPHIAGLGADAIWISPFFTSPMKDFGYDVSDYCDVDPMFGTLADFDARGRYGAPAGPAGDDRPGAVAYLGRSIPGSRKAARTGRTPGRLVCLGRSEARWHAAEQLAVDLWRLGLGLGQPARAVLPAQLPDQPARPELPPRTGAGGAAGRGAVLAGARRGRLPAGHDQLLLRRQVPARQSALPPELRNDSIAPSVNPYNHQLHLFSTRTSRRTLNFLRKFRAVLNPYGAAAVGEVGDAQRGLEIMAEYTSGGDKVQMCYPFEMLQPARLTAQRWPKPSPGWPAAAPDAWPCWAFPTTTSCATCHALGRFPTLRKDLPRC
jgi:hypothetical protein